MQVQHFSYTLLFRKFTFEKNVFVLKMRFYLTKAIMQSDLQIKRYV